MLDLTPLIKAYWECNDDDEKSIIDGLLDGLGKGYNYPRLFYENGDAFLYLSPESHGALYAILCEQEKSREKHSGMGSDSIGEELKKRKMVDKGWISVRKSPTESGREDRQLVAALSVDPALLKLHERTKVRKALPPKSRVRVARGMTGYSSSRERRSRGVTGPKLTVIVEEDDNVPKPPSDSSIEPPSDSSDSSIECWEEFPRFTEEYPILIDW